MAEHPPIRHVVAIDIDGALLDVARARLKEAGACTCDFIAGDAYDLARLWSKGADLVFMAIALRSTACPSQSVW